MKIMRETKVEGLTASAESKQKIYEFLNTHPVGVLSTADEDGNPHASVIYFSISEEFAITFVTRKRTRKYQNLQQDPRAMLVVFDSAGQVTVQISGVVQMIEEPTDLRQALQYMVKASYTTSKPGSPPPITKLDAGEYVAYQLLPQEIRYALFTQSDTSGNDPFETIYFTLG